MPRPDESRGDLTYIEGEAPQQQGGQGPQLVASIADISDSDVRADGGEVVFELQTAAPIPQPLKISALEFRWDIIGADKSSSTVSMSLSGRETQAAIISGSGYDEGTVDETLPGNLQIKGPALWFDCEPPKSRTYPPSSSGRSPAPCVRPERNRFTAGREPLPERGLSEVPIVNPLHPHLHPTPAGSP